MNDYADAIVEQCASTIAFLPFTQGFPKDWIM
jgi:hypothetical protein